MTLYQKPIDYPWQQWFNGQTQTIFWNHDYVKWDFNETLQKAAKRYGVAIKPKRVRDDGREGFTFIAQCPDNLHDQFIHAQTCPTCKWMRGENG